jgi:hypothetical protein
MRIFLEIEKVRQAQFKQHSPWISAAAREDGHYRRHSHPFCLPSGYTSENIFPAIRKEVRDYFALHAIKWHDTQDGGRDPTHSRRQTVGPFSLDVTVP